MYVYFSTFRIIFLFQNYSEIKHVMLELEEVIDYITTYDIIKLKICDST